jgi:hypothetical protein
MRKKLEVNQLEALAERATAVWHLAKEVQLLAPLSDLVINREWFDAWAFGSEHADVEAQVALMEKSDSFLVTQNIPTFKNMVDNHLFSGAPVVEVVAKMSALEVDDIQLLH